MDCLKAIRMIFLKHFLSKGISEILFWSILPHENVGQNATPKSALTRSKITVWLSHSKITFGAKPDLRQYSSHIRKNGLLLSVIKKTSPFKSDSLTLSGIFFALSFDTASKISSSTIKLSPAYFAFCVLVVIKKSQSRMSSLRIKSMLTSGCVFLYAMIAGISQMVAADTLILMVLSRSAFFCCNTIGSSSIVLSILSASSCKIFPSGVNVMFLPFFSKSDVPTSDSSLFIICESAGCAI